MNSLHSARHVQPHAYSTRRDFFGRIFGGAAAGASLVDLAFHRAAWARALAQTAGNAKLFDIHKMAEGVYNAVARPQALIMSGSVIFVNSKDVLVVDSQTRPSASAALINQIKAEITPKPVRYVVTTHFHDDHSQGNSSYKAAGAKVDFIAHKATSELMATEVPSRLKVTLEKVIPASVEKVRKYIETAGSDAEKTYWKEQLRQFAAFQTEMKNFVLVLPTITLDKEYVIKDKEHDLHIQFHGKGHTAGDVVVFCPQKKVVAGGDLINGAMPYLPDSYPKSWVTALDSIDKLAYDQVAPSHGPIMPRSRVRNFRNLIDEVNMRVDAGKRAGKPLGEMVASITADSLKSLKDDAYGEYVMDVLFKVFAHWETRFIGPKPFLQDQVRSVTSGIYRRFEA